MQTSRARVSKLVVVPCIVGLVGFGGCDKLGGDTSAEDGGNKPVTTAKPNGHGESGAEDPPSATTSAEEPPPGAGAAPGAPLKLADVGLRFEEGKALSDHKRQIGRISLTATLSETLEGRVSMKAACQLRGDVYIDMTDVRFDRKKGAGPDRPRKLGDLKEGDSAAMADRVFWSHGLAAAPSKCELEFILRQESPDRDVKLGSWCYDGTSTKPGACAGGVGAAAKGTGRLVPFAFEPKIEMYDGDVMSDAADLRSSSVHLGLRVNERIEGYSYVPNKIACKVGDRIWAHTRGDALKAESFPIEPGESITVHAGGFAKPIPGDPQWCDLELFEGDMGLYTLKPIGTYCWKPGGSVSQGSCDKRPAGTDAPLSPSSISIERMSWKWGTRKKSGKLGFAVEFDATLRKPVKLSAPIGHAVSCDGTDEGKHFALGVDLGLLRPGESLTNGTFHFLGKGVDRPVDNCEIRVSAAQRGGSRTELATFCIRGDKATEGQCDAKASKGATPTADTLYTARFP